MSALEIKNLSKRFAGVSALDHLSLSVKGGRLTAIIGPNGSGKTTLINVLTGLLPYESGSIIIGQGESQNKLQAVQIAQQGLTRTFQEVRLFNQMTVLDNILVVLTKRPVQSALFETLKRETQLKAETILKKVELWEKRSELAFNLSYGQRKLLEIARVLAMSSSLVLLDEPFAGLFPQMVKKVSDIIKDMRAAGTTLILIEHNMNLIRELADWVVVLDNGQILAQGPAADVLRRPEVIEAYLGD